MNYLSYMRRKSMKPEGIKPEEVNKALAEKCMGWHMGSFFSDTWWTVETATEFNDRPGTERYFDPYTRIEHAWMVVEKMKVDGYALLLYQPFGGKWVAGFDNIDDPKVSNEANTAPSAICLAALKAVKEIRSGEKLDEES